MYTVKRLTKIDVTDVFGNPEASKTELLTIMVKGFKQLNFAKSPF